MSFPMEGYGLYTMIDYIVHKLALLRLQLVHSNTAQVHLMYKPSYTLIPTLQAQLPIFSVLFHGYAKVNYGF